jgi:hypothetical protein
MSKKFDGTITSVVREIARLHNEIVAAARMSLKNAVEIGKHLYRIRESRKGKWLKWLGDNTPFLSQRTAYNYIGLYERRDELKLANVANLSDAYALLCAPKEPRKRRSPAIEQLVSKGIARDERDARRILRERREEPEPEPEAVAAGRKISKPEVKPEPETPKGWQPSVLDKGDLTDEELDALKPIHEYLASTPGPRCEVFLRYIRENLECGK